MGSVIKKRRKRMSKKKHRKMLRRTRVQRRKLGKQSFSPQGSESSTSVGTQSLVLYPGVFLNFWAGCPFYCCA